MKQQVLVIHGGTSFDTHEDYIEFLKTREVTAERLLAGAGDWKASLQRELGEQFEVLQPKMPNGTNARYEEWCIWLERCIPFLQDGIILIGHSLGGIFLAKYVEEHGLPKEVKATLLVGAPFDDDDPAFLESLTDFALPASLQRFEQQGGKIYLVYSKDDRVVPFTESKKYQQLLPQAQLVSFDDRGHFNQERFPELVALLQSLV